MSKFFFFKQKTAYEMRISDWSSDVCSSDLSGVILHFGDDRRMAAQYDIGQAIKTVRTLRGLRQEAFSDVSSRTYLSTLERGLKNPTLSKLAELCEVMQIHTLTLMRSEEHTSELQSLMHISNAVFRLKNK